MKILAVYLVIGIVIAEVASREERKRQVKNSVGVYMWLVSLWPVILYKTWKRLK